MPVPKPGASESQDAFHERCMRWLAANDPNTEQKQANAICYAQWRGKESDAGTSDGKLLDEAGRVLSEKSRTKMKAHLDSVRSACDSLETMLNTADSDPGNAGNTQMGPGMMEALREADVSVDLLITEAMSYGQQSDLIRTALSDRAGKNSWVWIRDVFPDRVVYNQEQRNDGGGIDEGTLMQCAYTVDQATAKVTLGDPVKVKQIVDYVVVESGQPPEQRAPEDGLPPLSSGAARPSNLTERTLSKEERDKIPAADFAGKNRSYFIQTPEDVAAAAASIGRAGSDNYDTDTLKANIIRIAKRHGAAFVAKLPDAWKTPQTESDPGEVIELPADMVPLSEATSVRVDGTTKLKLIAPGWGTSGYYPKEVLERDGPLVFTTGLKTFFDHPTKQEEKDRPERSLKELAGVLTSDAEFLEDGPAGPGLYADAKVFSNYREVIDEMAAHIGVSIRALGRASVGEAEGRKGPIVESIGVARSADFVTAAGAGGKVLPLLESARGAAGNPTQSDPQTKRGTDMPPDLDEEVRQQLKESRAEASANATALQEARRTIETQTLHISELQEKARNYDRVAERLLIREAADLARIHLKTSDLPEVTIDRLVRAASSNPPIKDGAIDEPLFVERLSESVREETAYIARVTDSGKVRGMGGTPAPADSEHANAALSSALGRLGLSEAGLKVAANGR